MVAVGIVTVGEIGDTFNVNTRTPLLDELALSVAVTVNVYCPVAVGVPEIWPVAEFKFNPGGRFPLQAKVNEPAPQQKPRL